MNKLIASVISVFFLNILQADELCFEYKGKYSGCDYDMPATNTGLAWMNKKQQAEEETVKPKKRKRTKRYTTSFKRSSQAFERSAVALTNDYNGERQTKSYGSGYTYVSSHTRRLKNGRITHVKGYYRRNRR